MADIQPFAAWHYDPARIKPTDVLTEPYDKISPAMQAAYYERSPHNLIRIELGRETDKYERAAQCLATWRKEGMLTQRSKPAIFLYEQSFLPPSGGPLRTRRALIARVRLSPFSEGKVLPHEHTLSKPKADRMSLLRTTQAYTGQIFLLYDGQKAKVPLQLAGVPIFDYTDEFKIQHRLSAIEDATMLDAIHATFEFSTLYIADGHHRYETAVSYRDERRAAAGKSDPHAQYEFVMAALVDYRDPGLTVLPTHRLVKNIANFDAEKLHEQLLKNFQMERHPDLKLLQEHLERTPAEAHCLGLFLPPNHFWLLRLRPDADRKPFFANKPPLWDNLDVAILHAMILEPLLGIDEARLREEANVEYYRSAHDAAQKVGNGKGQAVFFLKPTPVESVIAIAEARSRMPQKSTDFYPKFPSGLTIYDVSEK